MTRVPDRLTRRDALGTIVAAALVPSAATARDLATLGGSAFGTGWHLVGSDAARLSHLGPRIDALFADIDRQFSPWRSDSALSRFNAAGAGADVRSSDFADVTAAALDIAEKSAGVFDPTVGPLVARWGFGPIEGAVRGDWRSLSSRSGIVTKSSGDLTLDLCGIAKGWALDRAVDLAKAEGIESLLLDLGGEIRALGAHPSGRHWQVAVETPPTSRDGIVLRLPDGASLATSGVSAQGFRFGNGRYGHIIDPALGRPADGRLWSVTVLAGSAMEADGWATALFAAGEESGPGLAERNGIGALFLVETEIGLEILVTGRMGEVML